MHNEAGKGDKRRPENSDAFRKNYDSIFKKQPKKEQDNVVGMINLNKQLYENNKSGKNTT